MKGLALLVPLLFLSQPLSAETTIQLGANSVRLELIDIDDQIICKLNGKLVASQSFGEERVHY